MYAVSNVVSYKKELMCTHRATSGDALAAVEFIVEFEERADCQHCEEAGEASHEEVKSQPPLGLRPPPPVLSKCSRRRGGCVTCEHVAWYPDRYQLAYC